MNRREFILATGVMLLSGKEVFDILSEVYKNNKLKDIYSQLPSYVHLAELDSNVLIHSKEQNIKKRGCGVLKNGEYLSMAHIFTPEVYINSPLGRMKVNSTLIDRQVSLYNKPLEEIVCCEESDVARFKVLDTDCRFTEFPNKISEHKLGEEVYIIGNPYLRGANVRKANVSELDGFEDYKLSEDCFGVSTTLHPGDSGTPVVNGNGELLGLCCLFAGSDLGYIKPIKLWLD
jgi:hypothetical protein